MTSLQIPSQDVRAQQWVRAMSARPAGLTVDKEKVDTNLWNLLSGGKRNAPSQPLKQAPVQPSPRKFKQQLLESRESDPHRFESFQGNCCLGTRFVEVVIGMGEKFAIST